jgi:MFS family permease
MAENRSAVAIITVSALGSCAGAGLVLVGAARDSLASGYGVSFADLAWLTTGITISYALLQLPAGSWCDRWGPRKVAVLGAVGTLLTYALALVTADFTVAVIARVLAGAVTALCFVAGSELVRALGMPAWVQGLFGGLALGMGGVAFLVLPWLGTTALGWRAPWLFEIALAVIALIGLAFVPATPGRRTLSAHPAPRLSRVVTRPLLAIAAGHAATFALGVVLSNWLAVQLIRDSHLSQQWANLVSAVLLIVTAASRPLGGYLFDRTGSVRLTVLGPLAAGSLSLIALSLPFGPVWALLAAVAFGTFSGIPFAALFASARAEVPQAPGMAIGVINGLANLVILAGVQGYIVMIGAGWGQLGLWVMAGGWLLALLAVRPLAARPLGIAAPASSND